MSTYQISFIRITVSTLICLIFSVAGFAKATSTARAEGIEDNAIKRVNLPRPNNAVPLDLCIARTKVMRPSALLVIFLDEKQDANEVLDDPAWQKFAETCRLGLAALVTGSGPELAVTHPELPVNIRVTQAALILRAINHEFSEEIPLLLYAAPQRATLTQELLLAAPERTLGWCLWNPEHIRTFGSTMPPGIITCYKEDKKAYDSLMGDFTRGRKLGQRLTWLALPGDKPKETRSPSLESFARNYFAVLLSSKLQICEWENIETKQSVGLIDVNSHPEASTYLPTALLAPAWSALHTSGGPEIAQEPIIEREVDTFNSAQPKLHLYLRKPIGTSKTGVKIEGVLAFCTWEKDRISLIGRLQDRSDFLVHYADDRHLALLTWDTAKAWSTAESADERSQQENINDDLIFDKLANAWERGVHVLCHDAGLPETNFLLYGISRGAQWAHRLALRKPEHFLAVHIHINSTYDWPTPAAKNILWLETTGDQEFGYDAAGRFYLRSRQLGYPIIFKAVPNLGHSDDSQIDKLGLRFFDYAMSVKAKRDEFTKANNGKMNQPIPIDLNVLSGLANPPYYGDLYTQEVYIASQKDVIPMRRRVPLPTKQVAEAWGKFVEPSAPYPIINPVTTQLTP